jgi:hypothetical protein
MAQPHSIALIGNSAVRHNAADRRRHDRERIENDRRRVDPIPFNADDLDTPIGYGLVLELLVVLSCYVCALALGVLGGISWMNGWSRSATVLIAAASVSACVGAIGHAIGLPWLSGSDQIQMM